MGGWLAGTTASRLRHCQMEGGTADGVTAAEATALLQESSAPDTSPEPADIAEDTRQTASMASLSAADDSYALIVELRQKALRVPTVHQAMDRPLTDYWIRCAQHTPTM